MDTKKLNEELMAMKQERDNVENVESITISELVKFIVTSVFNTVLTDDALYEIIKDKYKFALEIHREDAPIYIDWEVRFKVDYTYRNSDYNIGNINRLWVEVPKSVETIPLNIKSLPSVKFDISDEAIEEQLTNFGKECLEDIIGVNKLPLHILNVKAFTYDKETSKATVFRIKFQTYYDPHKGD